MHYRISFDPQYPGKSVKALLSLSHAGEQIDLAGFPLSYPKKFQFSENLYPILFVSGINFNLYFKFK